MTVLPPRLEAVYSELNQDKTTNGRIIDVGSDHALFSIACLKNRITRFAIATDINKAPAERSRQALINAGFAEHIEAEVYNTDGITGITIHNNDTITIAGMGGNNIIDIMGYALKNIDESVLKTVDFIIQPQKSLDKVREFLSSAGFNIINEKVAVDNDNFYVIIKTIFTGESYSLTDEDLYYGPILLSKKDEMTVAYHKHLDEVFSLRARGDAKLRRVMENRGML